MQLKVFQLRIGYQLTEIQMVFHSNKTIHTAYNISKFTVSTTDKAIKHNLVQELEGQGS